MIRQAVGAIVRKGEMFLLVHKVKMMDGKDGPEEIEGEWDISKGGVMDGEDLSKAVLRELKEETGSDRYKVIRELDEKLCFAFAKDVQEKLGFERQETTVFLVEYLGDGSDIGPQDDEIDEVRFFSAKEVMKRLDHDNMREFFRKSMLE